MFDRVRELKEDSLLRLPNVVGVGAGKKQVKGKDININCIRVYVEKKKPEADMFFQGIVPHTINNVPTDVIEVGKIEAQEYTQKLRPTKCGISIGHFKITAGTLGCLVKDRETGAILILSNNHVLANSNDAQQGDAILQPGKHDGGNIVNDYMATLYKWIPLKWANWSFWKFWMWRKKPQVNYVDAAVAIPSTPSVVTPNIIDIGVPKGTSRAEVGMEVQKTGRTTEYTRGIVLDDDMTVTVNYKKSKPARFKHQILFNAMSAGGDSGSLILDKQNNATALLFAGSEKVTIGSPIQAVLDALNVELVV